MTELIVVPDTNFFMEFDWRSQADWNWVSVEASEIRIAIVPKVLSELDGHKRSNPRLRRRAIALASFLHPLEQDKAKVVVREKAPRITVELTPLVNRSDLNGNALDLADPDSLIVAQAEHFSRTSAGLVFISDDSNPRRIARLAGLHALAPPPHWRLREPEDEKDEIIKNLKKALGAAPDICVSFGDISNVYFGPLPETVLSETERRRLADLLLSRTDRPSADELVEKYGLSRDLYGLSLHDGGLAPQDVNAYELSLRKYPKIVSDWVDTLVKQISDCPAYPLWVEISNEGDAFAEDVIVTLRLSDGFVFAPRGMPIVKAPPKPPAVPLPRSSMASLLQHHIPEIPNISKASERDRFKFIRASEATRPTSNATWHCQRLSHGTIETLPELIWRGDERARGGLLTVEVRSASSPKVSKSTCLVVRPPWRTPRRVGPWEEPRDPGGGSACSRARA